jgi:protein ImuB
MLWLYLDFPSLQLDCLQKQENQQNSKTNKAAQAIVIVDSKKNSIIQLNTHAIAQGLRLGMGLAMAASLVDELSVLAYQCDVEHACLHSLCEQLYNVTAKIALFPPHGLALQVNDMLRLYGDIERYVQAITNVIAVFNVNYVAACGISAISAQLLACADVELITEDRSEIEAAIDKVSISRTFLDNKAQQSMSRLGIKTVGQLQRLPIEKLTKRFNVGVLNYLSQLNGQRNKTLCFYQPKDYFEHSVELLYEIKSIDVLLQPFRRLLVLLEAFLQRRNLICYDIDFQLSSRVSSFDNSTQCLAVHSAGGDYCAERWLTLVQLKLSNFKLCAPITKIYLSARKLHHQTGDIDDIFLGRKGQLSFNQLVSLLINKLGENKVNRLQLGCDHRPELSSRVIAYSALTVAQDKRATNTETNTFAPSANEKSTIKPNIVEANSLRLNKELLDSVGLSKGAKVSVRPSFILSEPEPLQSPVSILNGPERIEAAWWDGSEVRRDYFIAKNSQGQCCWIYRQSNNHWFLHGYFS